MFKFDICNGVLKKIYAEETEHLDEMGNRVVDYIEGDEVCTRDWGTYIVKVPDYVVEVGKNIFDNLCQKYVRAIAIPRTVRAIDDNAFNIKKIPIIIEEENKPLYDKFNEKHKIVFLPSIHIMYRLYAANKDLGNLGIFFARCNNLKATVSDGILEFKNEILHVDIRYDGGYQIQAIHIDNGWIQFNAEENRDKPDTYSFFRGEEINIKEINRLMKG